MAPQLAALALSVLALCGCGAGRGAAVLLLTAEPPVSLDEFDITVEVAGAPGQAMPWAPGGAIQVGRTPLSINLVFPRERIGALSVLVNGRRAGVSAAYGSGTGELRRGEQAEVPILLRSVCVLDEADTFDNGCVFGE